MITYTNIVKTKVLDPLKDLLLDEFPQVNVSYEQDVEGGFPSLLVIRPTAEKLIRYTSAGQERNYSISVSYFERFGGNRPKNRLEKITETAERLKRLMYNNMNYSGYWLNGRVTGINYNLELPDEYSGAELTFECQVSEII
ncbi:MAG: hypothetical protein H8D23_41240 [Candidatus Brocadiales bacterium]|nr:hypothetical protein [Candidatus Brocadiales bacterium]